MKNVLYSEMSTIKRLSILSLILSKTDPLGDQISPFSLTLVAVTYENKDRKENDIEKETNHTIITLMSDSQLSKIFFLFA